MEMADDPWTSYLSKLQDFSINTSKQSFSCVQDGRVNGRKCAVGI